jgi:hypothetical protein
MTELLGVLREEKELKVEKASPINCGSVIILFPISIWETH